MRGRLSILAQEGSALATASPAAMRARHPALVAGIANTPENRHRKRLEQILERADQRGVEHISIPETGQVSKMVGKLGHRGPRTPSFSQRGPGAPTLKLSLQAAEAAAEV